MPGVDVLPLGDGLSTGKTDVPVDCPCDLFAEFP